MVPKIAIIYTGLVRTIEHTLSYFKKNVLINENRHVFAILQSSNVPYFDKCVKDAMSNNLKSIQWFNLDQKWIMIRENLLLNMDISESWKQYLRNSGSMVEYYQMYLAYQDILQREKEDLITYDYILRIRCDVILTEPIFFDWDQYTIPELKTMLERIKIDRGYDSIINLDVLTIFMNSFYNDKRVFCKNISYDNYVGNYFKKLITLEQDEFLDRVHDYLVHGNYIITLRKNQIYFCKRHLFHAISKLGIHYGAYVMQNNNDWFNAESQLQQICLENKMDIFDSTTMLEGKSLYEYNESNYFDKGQLMIKNDFLFFIQRT